MEQTKRNQAQQLLHTLTYNEMTEEQKKLVTEYETEKWKPKVDELKKTMAVSDIQEQIHGWWLDYQFTDETEENLLAYVGG